MNSSAETTDPCVYRTSTQFGDSIANICWFPAEPSPAIAVSSWDSKITIYHAPQSNTSFSVQELTSISTDYPCLALSFLGGPTNLITGSIDGTVAGVDISTGRIIHVQTFGKHDDAVQAVYSLADNQAVCSLSYDKTMKVWDVRASANQAPIVTLSFGEKVVCSDKTGPLMIVGLANQKFCAFDVQRALQTQSVGPQLETTLGIDSPLSDVSISKDGAIGLGSLSGRSGVSWLKPWVNDSFTMSNTYCFKGHKLDVGQGGNTSNKTIMYPINAVGVYPKNQDVYFTAGRDGCVHFWNIAKRSRIGGFKWNGVPITKAKWSPDGKYLAYGVGYDWSKGIEGTKSHKTQFCVHLVQPNDLAKP